MSHSAHKIQLPTGDIPFLEGGSGPPLVYLHHSIGGHGWLPLHETLSETHRVILPDIPGFGESTRPDWARDIRDVSAILAAGLNKLGIERATFVGCGFGGWVAAELAVADQGLTERLVLVAPAGIQPRTGDIVDQLVVDYVDYVKLGFNDMNAFETFFTDDPPVPTRTVLYGSREMLMRIVWKPWMFRRGLPHLLKNVETPTTVLWGSNDRIIPLDSGKQYAEAMPNARLVVVEGGGHNLDFERPDQVVAAVTGAEARVAAAAR